MAEHQAQAIVVLVKVVDKAFHSLVEEIQGVLDLVRAFIEVASQQVLACFIAITIKGKVPPHFSNKINIVLSVVKLKAISINPVLALALFIIKLLCFIQMNCILSDSNAIYETVSPLVLVVPICELREYIQLCLV